MFRVLLSLALLVSVTARAESLPRTEALSVPEKEVLRSEADSILRATELGDAETIIAKTHPALFPLMGGQEQFTKAVRAGMEQIRRIGFKFLETTSGEPSPVYPAGESRLCFLPRVSVIQIGGSQKIRSEAFLIAIQTRGTPGWRFLDGAALQKNRELLWQLFPALSHDVPLPTYSQKPIP